MRIYSYKYFDMYGTERKGKIEARNKKEAIFWAKAHLNDLCKVISSSFKWVG